jgi:NADH-quinone oxidoreductase subunit N
MAAGVKAASFAALLRVSFSGLAAFESIWFELLIVLSVVTMTAGNLIALAQTNLKRMLAYSAIAHAGYLLIGVIVARPAAQNGGASGVLFYLFVYALMNLGAFALVSLVSRSDGENVALDGYAGLARRHPVAAAAMAVFMLSLAGIPPTAGFWGKLYVFEAAIAADHTPLAVIALLNSAVSIYYYLRVVVLMYMREPEQAIYRSQSIQTHAVMLVLAVLVLWVGLQPGPLSEWARRGAGALAGG